MISSEIYEDCKKMYLLGSSITKICSEKKIDRHSLGFKFKQDGVKVGRGRTNARTYNLNEHYFDKIDTEIKAYMLGFIYADGNNLFKTNRITIQLSIVDKEILQKFSVIMFNQENLKYRKNKNNKGEEFEYVSLNMYSKHMSQHLATLGVVERKSHLITFPEWLDKTLYKHFIRGLIDGDGWIYIPKSNRDSPNVGLICTRQINDFLQKYLSEELGLTSYLVKAYKQDINVMCEIRIKNYHQCKKMLDWLYQDANIFLQRKYDLYLNLLNKYDNLRDQNK